MSLYRPPSFDGTKGWLEHTANDKQTCGTKVRQAREDAGMREKDMIGRRMAALR